MRIVPFAAQKNTPIFVWGTAGMRLLSRRQQEGLWDSVFQFFAKKKKFSTSRNNFRYASN
jgi:Golgi nucleoside diphosphatase